MKPLLLCAALGWFASGTAAAQDVSISGLIIPGTCTPALANGGIVDFGAISVSALSTNTTTTLATKPNRFTVTCDASTPIAFRILDNRLATQLGAEASFAYGLGSAPNGAPIGRFRALLQPGTIAADAQTVGLIESLDASTWNIPTDNYLRHANPDLVYAFALPASTTPLAVTTAAFDFDIEPTINSLSALQVTQDAALDGDVTFEVIYL